MPSVLAGAAVDQHPAGEAAQPEDIVELRSGSKPPSEVILGAVEFRLDPAVEINQKSLLFCSPIGYAMIDPANS